MMDKSQAELGKILNTAIMYHGPIFDVKKMTIETPDGLTVHRDLITHAPAVAMLALTDDHQVLINREYRVAVNHEVYALPAGLINAGEDVPTAALRELREETGFIGRNPQVMTAIRSSEGMTDEVVSLVLVQIDEANRTTTDFDKDEFVTSKLVPLGEVIEAVKNGQIQSAQSVAAVAYYQAFLRP
ncbi:NUDIX hydrolase [Lacticaseibacillus brantae]|uniref:NUDIX family hydrolase n=1 Tax=Lacticaseibacillus brantae DSM 23927 TaxID=1423727 RepID=A0A0R2AZB6_9LACO|nr:NUDIX hydrolase [Lacticaseibacillus brantae]KRM72638.1 NUDIX family hydrolase [Lacticaseibacillus brantae DSM 23927]